MLNVVLTTALAALAGQVPPLPPPYPPDESDILRGADQHPMINLLLDTSGSMGSSSIPTPCADYSTRFGGGLPFNTLNKNQMMEAALTGCRTANDGVLDRWASRATFAVRFFGDNSGGDDTSQRAPFGAPLTALENAVRDAGAVGNTPMSAGLVAAARDFDEQLSSAASPPPGYIRSLQCRRNFVLLLSDGAPNGGDGVGNSACNGNEANVPSGSPWLASEYMVSNGDMLCSVDDEQLIGTYTLGFGAPGDFNPSYLQTIASRGLGRYFYASNVDSLNRAFEQIILSIVERGAVYGSGGTVQQQGLFSGDTNYIASYRTVNGGSWVGNLKRVCVTPRQLATRGPAGEVRYDTTDTSCMFRAVTSGASQTLVPNPTPVDSYTGTRAIESDRGGAGALLRTRLESGVGEPRPDRPRALFTYFPEARTPAYVRLDQPTLAGGDITDENLWIPSGDTWKIVNRLNGFTYDNDATTGYPRDVGLWPIGDAIHTAPVLLRYTETCATAGSCFVVLPTNNGIVNFIDARTGAEASALVPGELWRPSDLTHHRLADLERQPTFETARRQYIDGPAQLFHRDVDGDGVIEAGDTAYLVFGLGRGGRVYYSMDVTTQLRAGTLPPVHPLAGVAGSAFSELRDTWSNPWMGRVAFTNTRNVAIFSSGHVIDHDRPLTAVPGLIPGTSSFTTRRSTCPLIAVANGLPPGESCELNLPAIGNPGLDIPVGPFSLPNAVAYRVRFQGLRLSGDDRVYVTDGVERWASVVGGRGETSASEPLSFDLEPGGWSRWVYGNDFFVRLVSGAGRPVDMAITDVEYITQDRRPATEHYPNIYAVDLDEWNGSRPFDGDRDVRTVLARITRDCNGDRTNCIDAISNGAQTRDLRHMTCPISTEVSVVAFSNELRLYWGDECGQIFVATNPSQTRRPSDWTVRRLAHLSWQQDAVAPDMSSQTTALGFSRDVRKIYRRLDIVASTCPGRRTYAVYFGTGDVQRPLARADTSVPADQQYLRDTRLSDGRDVMGVIYDDDATRDLTLRSPDFYDATSVLAVPQARSQRGWFVRLGASEKMLRDPLVFQNVVYLKTFEPGASATECEAGSGTDRVYAMNSCTAEPILDRLGDGLTVGDRVASVGSEDIGPDPFVLTPETGPPIVVASGPLGGGVGTSVFQRAASVRPRIYNWRLPR